MRYEKYAPARQTVSSAGYDLCVQEDVELKPKVWTTVDTGVSFDGTESVVGARPTDVVERWWMAVLPRSSLGMKYGLRLHNTVGVIDMDYRGTIMLEVTVDKAVTVRAGERIAQGIVIPLCTFEGEIPPKAVRQGGMGSTGRM